ncbi:MAG: hypothetical protein H6875_00015 [Hyphomicrobiaceae bacterium]|nr:hypothetical protein [Hyphomicrobiaceae bacterium]
MTLKSSGQANLNEYSAPHSAERWYATNKDHQHQGETSFQFIHSIAANGRKMAI